MESVKVKSIRILSNGSLFLSFNNNTGTQSLFYEKDSVNFRYNKKKSTYKVDSESSFSYKKKYLN